LKFGFTAELVDPFGDRHYVFLLLFGVLGEFVFDAFAREASRCNGMHGVRSTHNDFRRENTLQNFDGLARITSVGRSDVALVEMLRALLSQSPLRR